MKLCYKELRDKIIGCYNGKNIGGTLGAPFEGPRQINDVSFYVQKDIEGNPPPNDDLDLQIVWLNAAERYGANVNHEILAEYWLTYIYPNWSEYGTGKANLKRGFNPPVSGRLENVYKGSCGSFIRSEIWACLAPAHPEIAAVYAYHDSVVDHADEGVYGEVFCAAVQSAAFTENDIRKLLKIGLSYVPENCAVARAVKTVTDCYDGGLTWLEAREKLFKEVPGSFGLQTLPVGSWTETDFTATAGLDAPNNIGIAVLGLLYGEGDFGKSICTAVNCGEDADCTAGFIGALYGIIYGNENIPEKWSGVLNGVINTCCINLSEWGFFCPKTVTEFADRILMNIPRFLQPDFVAAPLVGFEADGSFYVNGLTGDALDKPNGNMYAKNLWRNRSSLRFDINELSALPEYCDYKQFPAFKAVLEYSAAPYITEGKVFDFKLYIYDNSHSRSQNWADIKLYTGAGLRAVGGSRFTVPVQNTYNYKAAQGFAVELTEAHGAAEELLVEISLCGRHSYGVFRVTLAVADDRDVTKESIV